MPSILPILQRRRERRLDQERLRNDRLARSTMGCGSLLAIGLAVAIFAVTLLYAALTASLPSLEALPALLAPGQGQLYQPTRIYDRTGEHRLVSLSPDDTPHAYLSLDTSQPNHLPENLVTLTLALNDPDFYTHPGFTLTGWENPLAHPTLAQKLAADFLLWQEPPTPMRALRERLLAAQLTRRYGRDQILEWYLNSANYGRYATGAEAAARLYFGKPASALSLLEAAVLATVNQSPAINPLDAQAASLERAANALQLLASRGIIHTSEAVAASQSELRIQPAPTGNGIAPAFTSLALAQAGQKFSRARLERGGMVIISTLDYEIYTQALCATQTQLARLENLPDPAGACSAAADLPILPPGENTSAASASVIVLDPQNGQILAAVGEMRQGQESARLTGHKPGSSLIPFIYLTGFSRGLSPASLMWDINPDLSGSGPVRARLALANDYRSPAETILNEMSMPAVTQVMRPFGLTLTDTTSFDSLLDGPNLVSPLTMAQAYGVFSTNGLLKGQPDESGLLRPGALLRIETVDGETLFTQAPAQSAPVVTPQLAYLLTHVLSDASARWPSLGQTNPLELGRPVAAKLGQTRENTDAWAIGYTPNRVVVAWLGGQPASSRGSAGLWSAVMKTAVKDQPAQGWEMPPGVATLQVCDPSGMLPTLACPKLVNEIFLNGYEPLQADTLYQTWAINRETGFLATVFTRPGLVEERVYMNIPPEARAWAANQPTWETPPTTYDTIQPPPALPGLAISEPAMFATLGGKIQVRGSAGGEGFTRYRLQYGQGLNPSHWVLIAESENPVEAGLLAEWDASGLNGLYALQLVVIRADGRIETTTVQVTITP